VNIGSAEAGTREERISLGVKRRGEGDGRLAWITLDSPGLAWNTTAWRGAMAVKPEIRGSKFEEPGTASGGPSSRSPVVMSSRSATTRDKVARELAWVIPVKGIIPGESCEFRVVS